MTNITLCCFLAIYEFCQTKSLYLHDPYGMVGLISFCCAASTALMCGGSNSLRRNIVRDTDEAYVRFKRTCIGNKQVTQTGMHDFCCSMFQETCTVVLAIYFIGFYAYIFFVVIYYCTRLGNFGIEPITR